MDIYFILAFVLCFIYAFYKYKKALQMLQQNWYNTGNRYLKWLKNNFHKAILWLEIPLLIVFLPIDSKIKIIVLDLILICLCYLYRKRNQKEQTKIKLAVTMRIKRLLLTIMLIYCLPLLYIYFFQRNIWLFLQLIIVLNFLTYIIVVVANFINKPIEKMVFLHYRKQAVTKLNNLNNMNVIGITGSYGKTSSKNILYDVLNIKYNVFKTPKNFNTTYGLINSVNNYLDKFNDYFIAEMGAFKQGEIKELCDLMHPKYGIITTIGTAHLESFGSQENIMKGKFELIESLPEDGIGILNLDDPFQKKYELKNNCKILWYSTKNHDADLYAKNIKITGEGTNFDCIFKGDKNVYHFETCLLGEHNVYNILAAILLGYSLGIKVERLQTAVNRIEPIEHRLQLREYKNNITIIDDAYNSNPVGAKMALDVLKLMNGMHVVVTPGMIELGKEQYNLNFKFGTQISEVADYVILVGEMQTKPIYDGLLEKKFDKNKIKVINDVKEAFSIINKFSEDKVFVLLENDLPDIFNE